MAHLYPHSPPSLTHTISPHTLTMQEQISQKATEVRRELFKLISLTYSCRNLEALQELKHVITEANDDFSNR